MKLRPALAALALIAGELIATPAGAMCLGTNCPANNQPRMYTPPPVIQQDVHVHTTPAPAAPSPLYIPPPPPGPGLIDTIIGWQRQAEQKAELERQRAVKVDLLKMILAEIPRANEADLQMACGQVYPNAVAGGLIDMEMSRKFFRACNDRAKLLQAGR